MPANGKTSSGRFPISRRRFIQGVTAGTTAAVVAPEVARAQVQIEPEVAGQQRVAVRLQVNGRTYRLNIDPRSTLLEVLRNHLDLTGTKLVCDRGECGACTVLRDGQPVYACLMLALDAQGHRIETIESLSANGKLHPLQEAFVRHDALQCGFCTPGMVMACKGLLESQPNPTLDDIKEGLSGNLCKCGTYTKIFRAVQDAAQLRHGR
ncbi:MAG: (2Fe-2S)-binding protein [Terriglobia bacterium]